MQDPAEVDALCSAFFASSRVSVEIAHRLETSSHEGALRDDRQIYQRRLGAIMLQKKERMSSVQLEGVQPDQVEMNHKATKLIAFPARANCTWSCCIMCSCRVCN